MISDIKGRILVTGDFFFFFFFIDLGYYGTHFNDYWLTEPPSSFSWNTEFED